MKRCPNCKVQHLDGVDRCDCGYSFIDGTTAGFKPATPISKLKEGVWIVVTIIIALVIGAIVKELLHTQKQPAISESVDSSVESTLAFVSQKSNADLPRMIDRSTRIDTTFVGPGRRFTYVYTLTDRRSSDVSQDELDTTWKANAISRVCGTMQPMIDDGVEIVFQYFGNDGGPIGKVNVLPSDCR